MGKYLLISGKTDEILDTYFLYDEAHDKWHDQAHYNSRTGKWSNSNLADGDWFVASITYGSVGYGKITFDEGVINTISVISGNTTVSVSGYPVTEKVLYGSDAILCPDVSGETKMAYNDGNDWRFFGDGSNTFGRARFVLVEPGQGKVIRTVYPGVSCDGNTVAYNPVKFSVGGFNYKFTVEIWSGGTLLDKYVDTNPLICSIPGSEGGVQWYTINSGEYDPLGGYLYNVYVGESEWFEQLSYDFYYSTSETGDDWDEWDYSDDSWNTCLKPGTKRVKINIT